MLTTSASPALTAELDFIKATQLLTETSVCSLASLCVRVVLVCRYITNARSAELHKLFLAITHAYSSPLTRAVQTACGVLEGHVSLKEGRHLTLLSGIREIRSSIGSLDTSGSAVGAEIAGRVKSELEGLTGKARAAQLVPLIDPNDADSTYWSHLKDSKDRVRLRQDALLRLIR